LGPGSRRCQFGEDGIIQHLNINELLAKSGLGRDLGILSVDVDGNDYHILEQIRDFEPHILICEFNPLYGPVRKISTVYDPAFNRFRSSRPNRPTLLRKCEAAGTSVAS
jgi:hypothetical protein